MNLGNQNRDKLNTKPIIEIPVLEVDEQQLFMDSIWYERLKTGDIS